MSGGFRFGTEAAIHRSANRRATRARTSSHSSPTDSPDRTRRARRSISGACHFDGCSVHRRALVQADEECGAGPSVGSGLHEVAVAPGRLRPHSTLGRRSPTPISPPRVKWADLLRPVVVVNPNATVESNRESRSRSVPSSFPELARVETRAQHLLRLSPRVARGERRESS